MTIRKTEKRESSKLTFIFCLWKCFHYDLIWEEHSWEGNKPSRSWLFLVASPGMEPDSNCINTSAAPGLPLGLLLSHFHGNGHAWEVSYLLLHRGCFTEMISHRLSMLSSQHVATGHSGDPGMHCHTRSSQHIRAAGNSHFSTGPYGCKKGTAGREGPKLMFSILPDLRSSFAWAFLYSVLHS